MTGRIVGALLVLLALAGAGAAAGYVVGRDDGPVPESFAAPQAMPAESPSFPVNVYDVTPDPDTEPLGTDLALREETFRAGEFRLRAPVPVGWLRVELAGGDQWNFSVPDNPANTYLLRIGILAGDRRATSVETIARTAALASAEADGNFENLIVEEQTTTGFTATYLDSGGYQRVTIERFETVPGNDSAYFSVAVTGREVDRQAMGDLLDRVVEGSYVPDVRRGRGPPPR